MTQEAAQSRGYLREDFRLFRLKDAELAPIGWHYHTFHKVLIYLSGRAAYAIEGKSYALEPGDIVLVPKGAIHRPEVTGAVPYERVILYISPEFLTRTGRECDLEQCFALAQARYSYVLRPAGDLGRLLKLLEGLEDAFSAPEAFGSRLLRQATLQEFLIYLTRDMTAHQLRYVTSADCDEKVVSILKYLNLHLFEPVSIDGLAGQFYMSKYHMMRRFKAETGYTVHGYLTEKRLMVAREQLRAGKRPGAVCESCGFGDYTAFARAYKKRFGVSPTAKAAGETPIPAEPLD